MECRTNDTGTQGVLSTVSNEITYNCVMAERAFTRALGAHLPIRRWRLSACSRTATCACARNCSARTAARWSSNALYSTAINCAAAKELARSMLAGRAGRRAEIVRGLTCRKCWSCARSPAPAPPWRARARWGWMRFRGHCSKFSRSLGKPPKLTAFDGLLLTSANALRHGGEQLERLRGLKVYAVGEATARAAHDAGFDAAATGDAGVERLLASIEPDLRLLHLCGADRREAGHVRQTIVRIVSYRSEAVDAGKLPEADVVLVHSPRAGARLAEVAHDRSSMAVAAISQAAADAVGGGWQAVEVARAPTDDALLARAAVQEAAAVMNGWDLAAAWGGARVC